jgi:hypothetical protein
MMMDNSYFAKAALADACAFCELKPAGRLNDIFGIARFARGKARGGGEGGGGRAGASTGGEGGGCNS